MEEKLKQNWRDTRFSSNENPERMKEIMDGRRRTALERLAARYRRFSIIGFLMPVACAFYPSHLFGGMTPWLSVALVAYFLLCGVMDDWFCRGIQSIDVATMPIAEVAAKALYYKKKHLQAVALLMPIAMCLIGFFVYAGTGDPWFLAGVIVGALVGLAIGLMQLNRFMADYRNFSE